MGLGKPISDKKYVTITNGAFCVRVPADTEGAVKRVLEKGKNAGKEIWEMRYRDIEGVISSLKYSKSEYGDRIEMEIDDITLQIGFDNFGLRDAFVKRLPGVNFELPVKFVVFPDKDTGRAVLLVYHGDQLLPYHFTKDNPNGMPEAEKKVVRGEDKWDFSAQEDFLYKVLLAAIDRCKNAVRLPVVEEEAVIDYNEDQEVELPEDTEEGMVGGDPENPPF